MESNVYDPNLFAQSYPQSIKCVVVGDCKVGKEYILEFMITFIMFQLLRSGYKVEITCSTFISFRKIMSYRKI